MNLEIPPDEHEIVGNWVFRSGVLEGDALCKHVEPLVEHHLEQIAFSPESGAWETLFLDPRGSRYWERTYLQSEMHGGGPPSLIHLSESAVRKKYNLK
jgi:hypothetical protein